MKGSIFIEGIQNQIKKCVKDERIGFTIARVKVNGKLDVKQCGYQQECESIGLCKN